MREDRTASTEYLLRVAAEEIDVLEDRDLLRTYPSVAVAIRHPAVQLALRHIQNLCWTIERARKRSRRKSSAPATPSAAKPASAAPGRRTIAPIWIDVTNAWRTGYGGGIDRVAMKLAQAGLETGSALPVVIEHGSLRPLVREDGDSEALTFVPGVTYVIVDAFWHQIEEYVSVCTMARARGARVVTCFHDVIPLDYPSLSRVAFNDGFAQSFARIVAQSDACVAVSEYTSARVRALVEASKLRGDRPLPIRSFRLGADGPGGTDDGVVRAGVRQPFAGARVFLGVGTLEPRKGYAITLDAFDRLWQRGSRCRFVILGRYGWMARALERRILTHPLYGKALHWVADASDAELAFAYRNAYCLVQASIIEGFGLPIVEANREGTPVIATDNAIFRELAGDTITYFRSCDSIDLANVIERVLRERPTAKRLDVPSWTESLQQMVARITDMAGEASPASRHVEPPEDVEPPKDVEPSISEQVPFRLRPQNPYVTRSAPCGRLLPEGDFPCRNGAVPA